MRPSHFNFSTWLTGHSGWSFYCATISLFGLTGYYADILRPHIPDWLAVGLLIAPIAIIVFIQWGEAPDRVVAASHTIAASWFMLLALGMDLGIHLGHVGDSVFNSLSDIFFAGLGFLFTWRARVWVTILAIVAMEIGTALWVRDNLTLNIIMLVHPIEAIKAWQTAGCPLPQS